MVMLHMLGSCGGSRCIYGDVAYAGVLLSIEVYLWWCRICWGAVGDRGVSMVMYHMLGCCGGARCGGADPSSFVKTLWNQGF